MLLASGVSGHAVAETSTASADEAMTATEAPLDARLAARPRWEFGVGAGYVETPDYPASANTNRAALALPFFIYRSPLLRFDDGGLQAVAFENPRLKIDFSVGGSLSANSDAGGLREGMPDLDYLFELGPELTLLLSAPTDDRARSWRMALDLRLRAVVSTDFVGIDRRGTVLESALTLRRRALADRPLDAFASLSGLAATRALHDYFYGVDARFARVDRPAFDADGGYLGSQLTLGFSYRPRGDLRLVVALARDFHHGAANTDSPLFERRSTGGIGIGLVWTIRESTKRVRVLDTE